MVDNRKHHMAEIQEQQRLTAEQFRKRASRIGGFSETLLPIPNSQKVWINSWKEKHHPNRTDGNIKKNTINILDNCINQAQIYEGFYTSQDKPIKKELFSTTAEAIKGLKQYIIGERNDVFIDDSLRLLQDTYNDLHDKRSAKLTLNPVEKQELDILDQLKSIEIVTEPQPLSTQYVTGAIESIQRHSQLQSEIQNYQVSDRQPNFTRKKVANTLASCTKSCNNAEKKVINQQSKQYLTIFKKHIIYARDCCTHPDLEIRAGENPQAKYEREVAWIKEEHRKYQENGFATYDNIDNKSKESTAMFMGFLENNITNLPDRFPPEATGQ